MTLWGDLLFGRSRKASDAPPTRASPFTDQEDEHVIHTG
jgi:hypothetical protein